MTQTAGFSCRKWTIIGLCSLLLIVKAIAICVFVADFDSNIDKINQDKKPWEKLTKFHAIVSVVLPNVVYVIVSLIGICGAIKESFCLSTTFCVLFVYPAIKMIIDLSNDSKYWYEFIVIAVLAAAEIYFVIDLFKDRSKLTSKSQSSSSSARKQSSAKAISNTYSGASSNMTTRNPSSSKGISNTYSGASSNMSTRKPSSSKGTSGASSFGIATGAASTP